MPNWLETAYDFMLKVADRTPQHVWDILIAFVVSWVFLNWSKFYVAGSRYSHRERLFITSGCAFIAGFGLTYALWTNKYGFAMGICVGGFSPAAYEWTVIAFRHFLPWASRKFKVTPIQADA